ncbi:MAG TPA: VWA domain-containing protein, partial [Kofleriaceae bacterium]
LVLLIDTSGSMGGAPLTAAKQVLGLMIGTLGDGDQLEMIEFSSSPNRWKPEPVTTDAKTRAAAQAWVNSLEAGGATEMRTAVISALRPLRIGAQRQVVLVTDGYVGGEQQILEELHRKLPASCRMHFLGVGSACNRSLAQAVARAGRGAEVIVGPDEDPERGAKRLLDRTRLPMLTNVEISGSALQRHAPEKIPDVFEAAPLVAALAIDPNGGELVVRGRVADDDWQQVITVPARQPGDGNQAIAALYGRERVADVEAHAMFESRDGEIEDLGMTYQIATKMTSWVAIDDSRIVTGPSRDELVPQELPYGTSMQAFGLRQAHIAMPMQAPAFPMGGFAGLPPAPGGVARGLAGPPPGSAYEQLKHLITDDAPAESVDADEGDFGEQEHTGSFAKADKKAEEAPKSVPSHAAPQYMPQSIAPQQQPREKQREAATVSRAPAPAEPQKSVTRSSSTRWLLALVVALLAIIAALLWWLLA